MFSFVKNDFDYRFQTAVLFSMLIRRTGFIKGSRKNKKILKNFLGWDCGIITLTELTVFDMISGEILQIFF